jgi:hypothetical protein
MGTTGLRQAARRIGSSVDASNSLHQELATEGSSAEKVASLIELPEDTHFIRARGFIRKALREDGVARRIEKLVARLLIPAPAA